MVEAISCLFSFLPPSLPLFHHSFSHPSRDARCVKEATWRAVQVKQGTKWQHRQECTGCGMGTVWNFLPSFLFLPFQQAGKWLVLGGEGSKGLQDCLGNSQNVGNEGHVTAVAVHLHNSLPLGGSNTTISWMYSVS